MKILMINKYFYKKGGSEAYMFALRDLLTSQGHQVIDFSMQDPENQESDYSEYFIKPISFSQKEGGVKDFKKAWHLLYSFEAKKKLEQLIKKQKPDIAHLHNFYFHLTPSIIKVLKKHQIPIVWTLHDYKLICPNYKLFTQGQVCERCRPSKYYNCLKYKCLKNKSSFSFIAMLEMYLHKSILKSYDQVNLYLAPSKFMADKVIEWGIEPPKVKQIYNFINLDKYQPVDDLGDYVLYFGRLSQEKGLLDLVATAKDLPELKFKIAGKGPLAEKLKAYIIKQQIQNIELVGYKAGADLTELIQKSRLVILPSIWYENNPISIYEAWALGKSVIASDLGGNSELIEKSQAGELFQAGDKKSLKSLLKTSYYDKNKLIQQGKNGRKYLENYINSGKHWQQLEKIYQRLI